MGRTLTSHNQAAVVKTVTEGYYLVELGFDSPLYFSELYEQTLDSKFYRTDRNISVGKISFDKNGNSKSFVSFPNIDNWASILVLGESPSGKTARIHEVYGDNPSVTDMVLMFSGKMDKATIDKSGVKIELFSNGSENYSPGLVIAKPWYNWLPPAGTQIDTGTQIITLESAN